METSPRVEEHIIQIDGRRVFYTARGPEDAEYIYVGINGLMGGGDSFWAVIQGVPDTWRVVLPDFPGCGRSDILPAPYKHDIAGYAAWLGRFLATAGMQNKKIVLASVATGAPISIRYTFEHPEQVVGQVLHLPFLGKLGISSKWMRPVVAYSLQMAPLRTLVDALRSSDYIMHKIILHEPPDAIPELAERDIDHKQQADLAAAGELLHDLMLSDARAELKHLHQPVLILASEHDFAAPMDVIEHLVHGRPERRLYVYRGGQHSWNEEFVDDMNREIKSFLTAIEAKRAAPVR